MNAVSTIWTTVRCSKKSLRSSRSLPLDWYTDISSYPSFSQLNKPRWWCNFPLPGVSAKPWVYQSLMIPLHLSFSSSTSCSLAAVSPILRLGESLMRARGSRLNCGNSCGYQFFWPMSFTACGHSGYSHVIASKLTKGFKPSEPLKPWRCSRARHELMEACQWDLKSQKHVGPKVNDNVIFCWNIVEGSLYCAVIKSVISLMLSMIPSNAETPCTAIIPRLLSGTIEHCTAHTQPICCVGKQCKCRGYLSMCRMMLRMLKHNWWNIWVWGSVSCRW